MSEVRPEEVGLSSARLARIGQVMRGYIERDELAGMVTLVARKGRIAHLEAHGRIDIAADQPMPLDAIFRVFSMSKPVTGVALMMLHEEARFHLDDPVAQYIPAFKDTPVFDGVASDGKVRLTRQERPMTVRHLLTHTSGLSYGSSNVAALDAIYQAAGLRDWSQTTLPQVMEKLAQVPLLYQPGSEWR